MPRKLFGSPQRRSPAICKLNGTWQDLISGQTNVVSIKGLLQTLSIITCGIMTLNCSAHVPGSVGWGTETYQLFHTHGDSCIWWKEVGPRVMLFPEVSLSTSKQTRSRVTASATNITAGPQWQKVPLFPVPIQYLHLAPGRQYIFLHNNKKNEFRHWCVCHTPFTETRLVNEVTWSCYRNKEEVILYPI